MLQDEKTLMHGCLDAGRPFVIEISKPKKRFVDLKQIEAQVNADAVGKVEVSGLHFATKDDCSAPQERRRCTERI